MFGTNCTFIEQIVKWMIKLAETFILIVVFVFSHNLKSTKNATQGNFSLLTLTDEKSSVFWGVNNVNNSRRLEHK